MIYFTDYITKDDSGNDKKGNDIIESKWFNNNRWKKSAYYRVDSYNLYNVQYIKFVVVTYTMQHSIKICAL